MKKVFIITYDQEDYTHIDSVWFDGDKARAYLDEKIKSDKEMGIRGWRWYGGVEEYDVEDS